MRGALLLLLLAAPLALAAPAIPGAIHGQGTASHFDFGRAEGYAIEGGAYEWDYLCVECPLQVTIRDGTFVYYDPVQGSVELSPGVYAFREFRGLFFVNKVAAHEFAIEAHGVARVARIG